MLAEARSRTNRHTEVQARMLVEARSWKYLLRVRACKEARDCIFILKVGAFTEAYPWMFPRERWYNKEGKKRMMCMGVKIQIGNSYRHIREDKEGDQLCR